MKSIIVRPSGSRQLSPKPVSENTGSIIFFTVLAPVLPTYLIWAGNPILGAGVMAVVAFVACLLRARLALTCSTEQRFAFGIDAMLFIVISIISAVVVGNLLSPEDSKLYRLGYSGFAGASDILPSYTILIWCFSLATFPLSGSRKPALESMSFFLNKRSAVFMALLGMLGLVLSLTVSRYEVFSNRGDASGNGLNSLLYWSAAVFACYVVLLYKSQNSKLYLLTACLMIIGLLATGNRSPIVLIGIAVVVRVIIDRRRSVLKAFIIVFPIGIFIMSYQSVWRSLVSHGLASSPLAVTRVMAENPLQEFLRLGLDTVDGHSLVTKILDGGFEAQWLDPLLAVLNFVPRQIWSDKPILLGSSIGQEYLGLTAGGIFLSGPGYLSLVSGSLTGGSILFVTFLLFLKFLVGFPGAHPLVLCSVYYLAIRFSVAGDAFDIFLSIQIIVIFGISSIFGKALPWLK